ncbi:hypothetical protein [Pseudomonas aeruginosa]
MLGQGIRDDLPWQHLLSYVEAILRVYNRYGRRAGAATLPPHRVRKHRCPAP